MITRFFQSVNNDVSTSFQLLQAVRLGSVIIVSILLVKLGISTTELSNFEWFLFLGNAFTFFWARGLHRAVLNFAPSLHHVQRNKFESSIAILFLVFALLSVLIALVSFQMGWVSLKTNSWRFAVYTILLIPSTLVETLMVVNQQAKQLNRYTIAVYFAYCLFLVVGFISNGINGLFAGIIIWVCIRYLYLLYYLRNRLLHWDAKVVKRFIPFAFPLIIYSLVGNSVEFVDGFLVRSFFEDYFAQFRYGARELPLNLILITSFLSGSIPLAVQNFSAGIEKVKTRLSKLIFILFPICIVLMLISKPLFQMFYSEEFLLSAQIFNVFLLLLIPRILAPQFIFLAKQNNRPLMIVGIIETILNVGLSIFLLQYFGLLGIAYATIIANVFEKGSLLFLSKAQYKIGLNQLIAIQPFIIFSIVLIVSYVVSLYLF